MDIDLTGRTNAMTKVKGEKMVYEGGRWCVGEDMSVKGEIKVAMVDSHPEVAEQVFQTEKERLTKQDLTTIHRHKAHLGLEHLKRVLDAAKCEYSAQELHEVVQACGACQAQGRRLKLPTGGGSLAITPWFQTHADVFKASDTCFFVYLVCRGSKYGFVYPVKTASIAVSKIVAWLENIEQEAGLPR